MDRNPQRVWSFADAFDKATSGAMVSWPLVAWVTIGGLLISGTPHDSGFNYQLLGALAGVIATLAMFLALYVLWFALLRHLSGTTKIILVLVCYAVLGTLRGFVLLNLLSSFLGIEITQYNLLYRVGANTTQMLVLLSLGTWVVAMSRRQRTNLAVVEARQVEVTESLAQLRVSQQESLDSAVGQISETLHKAGIDPNTESLDDLNAKVIRPLSHSLASRIPTYEIPAINPQRLLPNWWSFWWGLNFSRFIQPSWIIVVTFIAWIGPGSAVFGLRQFVIAFAVFAVVTFVVLHVIRRVLTATQPLPSLPRFIIGLGLIILAPIPGFASLGLLDITISNRSDFALAAIIQAAEIFVLVTVANAMYAQEQLSNIETAKAEHELDWIEARASLNSWHNNGSVARALHGPVQSEIMAIHATELLNQDPTRFSDDDRERFERLALDQPDTYAYVEALPARVAQILDADNYDTTQSLTQTVKVWKGICQVHFTAEPAAEQALHDDAAASDFVNSLVQDATSNAVNHGRATEVSINVSCTSPQVGVVTVTNNGTAAPTASSQNPTVTQFTDSGFGTAQLQACSLRWERTSTAQGTVLKAEFPLGDPVG